MNRESGRDACDRQRVWPVSGSRKKKEIDKRGDCEASELLHSFEFRTGQGVHTEYPRGLAEWRFRVCQATGMRAGGSVLTGTCKGGKLNTPHRNKAASRLGNLLNIAQNYDLSSILPVPKAHALSTQPHGSEALV